MNAKFIRSRGRPQYEEDGYQAQVLYGGESAVVIGSRVRAGSSAPPHHMHEHSDQLFYVLEGEMHVQLGAEEFVAPPNALVYIPRGTPHHNWNEGAVDEFHFEVLAPPPLLTQPAAVPTDSWDAAGRGYLVRRLEDVGLREVMPGFSAAYLLDRRDGAEEMALFVGQVEPRAGGPDTHIHAFDQFYYVLEGELTVEVALSKFTAGPHDLVILPAGVPHRQWNDGSVKERHLTLLVPEPLPGEQRDVGVDFAARGVSP